MEKPNTDTSSKVLAKTGVYLRQSPKATPGIMTLDGSVLSFKTKDRGVFMAPLSELTAELSKVATLTIRHGQESYVFIHGGYAPVAEDFSPEQLKEIADAGYISELGVARGFFHKNYFGWRPGMRERSAEWDKNNTGGPAVTVGRAAQHFSFDAAKEWAEYLRAHGLSIDIRATTFGSTQLLIAAIVVPAIALMAVIITVVMFAIS